MGFNISRPVSFQIKITVIRQVQQGIPVAFRMIRYLKLVGVVQGICNLHVLFSRKSQRIVILQKESDTVISDCGLPITFMVTILFMAVKIVISVVGIQMIRFPIQRKYGSADPVRVGSHRRTKEIIVAVIVLQSVKAENDVPQFSPPVRYPQVNENRAVINDRRTAAIIIFDGIQKNFFSAFTCTEAVLYYHRESSIPLQFHSALQSAK